MGSTYSMSSPLPARHHLTEVDSVILTPHCAGVTPEVLEAGLALAIDNVETSSMGRLVTLLLRLRRLSV
jgi:phosphoglycerate dehydrogenase-like enzyme